MRALWTVGSFCVVSLVLGCNDDSGGNEGGAGGGSGSGASAGRGGTAGGSAGRAGTGASGGSAGRGGTGAGGGAAGGGGVVTYGQKYEGGEFHLGPVDWQESEWHNACAAATKYPAPVRQAEGRLLAGIWNGIPDVARYCDACIHVTTARGKSAILRVVTYGDTSPNSIDVSPEAYEILNSGEYPRSMSWQFAKCPDTGNIMYEFKAEAHEFWTALWVRNARVPIERVEVRSAARPSFSALVREADGSVYAHEPGFGVGPFTLRLTAVGGQQLTHEFSWPAAGIGGQLLTGQGNFQ
jgi:expansin (peptidoglycan-binding protein)